MKKEVTLKMVINVILFAVLVFLDQLTKILAVGHLKGQDEIVWIPGVFELRYLENRGAAFGMLQEKQWVFLIIAALFLIIACMALVKIPNDRKYWLLRLTIILIASGALGNMVDRFANRFVVDFFYFSLINFPIFNVADIYVSVGCALMVILILFVYKEEDLKFFERKKKEQD